MSSFPTNEFSFVNQKSQKNVFLNCFCAMVFQIGKKSCESVKLGESSSPLVCVKELTVPYMAEVLGTSAGCNEHPAINYTVP